MAAIDDQILALEKAIASPATSASFIPAMKEALVKLKLDKANAPITVTAVTTPAGTIMPDTTQIVSLAPTTEGLIAKIRANVPVWAIYTGIGVLALGSLFIVKKILS